MHGNLHFLFLSRLLYVICVKISIIMERTRIIWNNNVQTGLSKSSRLPSKIAAYLVRIGRVLCLAFLYGWCFLKLIKYAWTGRLLWQLTPLLQNFLTTLIQSGGSCSVSYYYTVVVTNMNYKLICISQWKRAVSHANSTRVGRLWTRD